MSEILDQIVASVSQHAPRVLGALAILVIGWLVALAISAGLRSLLRRTGLNERLPGWLGTSSSGVDAASGVARIVFYVLILFVVVAMFQTLGLTIATEPLNDLLGSMFAYAPRLLGAAALLVLAIVLASVVRKILTRLLEGLDIDRRLNRSTGAAEAESGAKPAARGLAETAYWLILLLFLPAILGALGMRGLLTPVETMVQSLVGFVPNLLAAAAIFLVGWFVARVVRRVVTGLLAAAGADALAERLGAKGALGATKLSGLVGTVVHALILIPVVLAALNALQLDAVTAPASQMLETILTALPQIFAAALILILSLIVGRLVAGLVTNVLSGVGFDRLPAAVGLRLSDADTSAPSRWAGTLVLTVIILFAAAEAAGQLGFDAVADIVARFLVFAGQVVLGLIILTIGLFLANAAGGAVRATGRPQSNLLAGIARAAVLVLTGAMALREMGFASDIVNLAFGLLFGAVAAAGALAFGIGGREAAAEQLRTWREKGTN